MQQATSRVEGKYYKIDLGSLGAPSFIALSVDMKPAFTSHQQLREHYQAEMAAMRQSFDRTGNGVLCIRRRALVVDCLLEPLWRFESGCYVTRRARTGGGRRLRPQGTLPFLRRRPSLPLRRRKVEDELRETIRGCNQAMWDLGLRASPMIRTLKECDRYDPDNIEFTLSLLDRRFIAGDHSLYQTLTDANPARSRAARVERHRP